MVQSPFTRGEGDAGTKHAAHKRQRGDEPNTRQRDTDHDGMTVRVARPDGTQIDLPAAHPRRGLYCVPMFFDQERAWVAQFHGGDDRSLLGLQIPIMVDPRDDQFQY